MSANLKQEATVKKWYSYLYDFWVFVWYGESLLSWVTCLALSFIIIKYLVYPGLGLILGTPYPVVAVVSGSMEHNLALNQKTGILELCGNQYTEKFGVNFEKWWGICGQWYDKNTKIKKEEFYKFRFKNGFNTGDLMVLFNPKKLSVGNVVVYNSNKIPIIHRIVALENGNVFITKGDHNSDKDRFPVTGENIAGKAVFRVPYLGWLKLLFVKLVNFVW